MRLRRMCSFGEANSALTLDHSQSSSSATSWASAVYVPWPISERAIRITTRSSGWITIQALTSVATASPLIADTTGNENSSARPPLAAIETLRNSRRESAIVMAASSCVLERGRDGAVGERMDRLAYPGVGAAAAEVGHGRIDVGVGRLRIAIQQRRR